jgi:hypothetical protein
MEDHGPLRLPITPCRQLADDIDAQTLLYADVCWGKCEREI